LTESEAAAHAKVSEVETEIERRSIERQTGNKTDASRSHMGTLYQSKELFAMFLKVCERKQVAGENVERMVYATGILARVIATGRRRS
jgi:hypothetical protein